VDVRTAVNSFSDEQMVDSAFGRVGGVLFLSPNTRCRDRRNLWYFESGEAARAFGAEAPGVLRSMRLWTQLPP
jgi:hypothetical protein